MTQASLTEFGADTETDEDGTLPPASELVKECRTYQYRQEKRDVGITDNEKNQALRRTRYAYYGVSAPLEPIHHRDERESKTETLARRHHREVMESDAKIEGRYMPEEIPCGRIPHAAFPDIWNLGPRREVAPEYHPEDRENREPAQEITTIQNDIEGAQA